MSWKIKEIYYSLVVFLRNFEMKEKFGSEKNKRHETFPNQILRDLKSLCYGSCVLGTVSYRELPRTELKFMRTVFLVVLEFTVYGDTGFARVRVPYKNK